MFCLGTSGPCVYSYGFPVRNPVRQFDHIGDHCSLIEAVISTAAQEVIEQRHQRRRGDASLRDALESPVDTLGMFTSKKTYPNYVNLNDCRTRGVEDNPFTTPTTNRAKLLQNVIQNSQKQ